GRVPFAQPLVPEREQAGRCRAPRVGQRDGGPGNALFAQPLVEPRLFGQAQRSLDGDFPFVEAPDARRLVGAPTLVVEACGPFMRADLELPAFREACSLERRRGADIRRTLDGL